MNKEKPTTKLCKHCKTEIPREAKVCPACRKKQGSKTVWIVIAAVVIILFAAAASGGDDGPMKVGDVTGNGTDTSTVKTSFTVGETAECRGIKVTHIGVTESYGTEFLKPDDGRVYLICEFEIANDSDKDISVSSIMSFDAYVDDYSANMSIGAVTGSDKSSLDGTVAAGKKMNGVIGYEAAEDWSELEIRFTADFWSDKPFIFTAKNG